MLHSGIDIPLFVSIITYVQCLLFLLPYTKEELYILSTITRHVLVAIINLHFLTCVSSNLCVLPIALGFCAPPLPLVLLISSFSDFSQVWYTTQTVYASPLSSWGSGWLSKFLVSGNISIIGMWARTNAERGNGEPAPRQDESNREDPE